MKPEIEITHIALAEIAFSLIMRFGRDIAYLNKMFYKEIPDHILVLREGDKRYIVAGFCYNEKRQSPEYNLIRMLH